MVSDPLIYAKFMNILIKYSDFYYRGNYKNVLRKRVLGLLKILKILESPFENFSIFVRNELIFQIHDNIGIALIGLGQYEDALRHCKLALEIAENTPLYRDSIAGIHNNIGVVNHCLGLYEDALHHHKLALEIIEDSLSPDYPNIATTHNYLGLVYFELSQYEDALRHYKLALDITENLPSPDRHDIAGIHNNIGGVYTRLGLYEDALRHLKLAFDIATKSLPLKHPHIGVIHHDMGVIYGELGLYEDALRHSKLALNISKKSLPPKHPDSVKTHYCISVTYCKLGRYKDALRHGKLALKISKKSLPPGHPDIALTHRGIGVAYGYLGLYKDALRHSKLALEIAEKSLPPEHPDIAQLYSKLIIACYDHGDNEEVLKNFIALTERLQTVYLNIMSTYSENFRTNLLRSISKTLSVLNTVANTNSEKIDTKVLYGLLLRTKDIGAEAEFAIRASSLPELYPEYADGLIKLKEKQQRRDHLMMNDPAQKEEIESLSKEIQDIEIQLSPYVKEIDFKRYMAGMTAETVLEKLPQNHALLEYGWYYYQKSAADTRTGITNGGRYYVYLLRDGEITLRYLEDSDELIHEKLYEVRRKITATKKNGSHLSLEIKEELRELYRMLISPFAEFLHDIEHLYIAPDGELYKLPFELLLDENNCAFSDRFAISYLSSGRDLARPERWNKPVQGYTSAAILADPLYDLPDGGGPETASDDDNSGKVRGIRSRQSRDWDIQTRFSPLPFGKVEADALDRVFGGKKDIRYQLNAKKSTLNEIGSPEIIHIITHGFAHEKQELTENQLKMLPVMGRPFHGNAENPLIRSGLAFSGANTWLKSDRKNPLKEYGDGILNAKEVLSLELHGTDLLVLSACQTALGETKNGEGIKGLRRSFELAGVRSILCTLWSVADDASAILMEKFYENLLNKGMDKLQSLTNAKEYIKNMTNNQLINYYREIGSNYEKKGFKDKAKEFEDKAIHKEESIFKDDSEEKPFKHPYFWAGYILQGDISRPLT